MVQVAVHTADSVVVVEELLAGEGGKHVDDLVALNERPENWSDAAEIERHPSLEEGVARDAVEFHRENADVLRAARHIDIHQLLKRGDWCRFAEERAHIFEWVGVADRLVVVGVLAELLHATV